MPARRLILYLDGLPKTRRTTTRAPKNTNGPLTGRGRPTKAKRKSRNENMGESDDDNIAAGDIARDSSDRECSPSIFGIKQEGDGRFPKKQKIDLTSLRKMVYVAGLDPGMSGSGMCNASKQSDPALVVAEMNWPESDGKAVKVPSVVALAADNVGHRAFLNDERSYFGFAVPMNAACRSFYKISLDAHALASDFDDSVFSRDIARMLVKSGDTEGNLEAMVTAMKHLRQIHLQKVRDSLGDEMVGDIKFVFVFTHPAACSLRGINALYEAACEAGYLDREGDEVRLMSEAHAAAIAAFVGAKAQHGNDAWKTYFKLKSLITVIDIGALTVDSTTVEIINNDPKLKLGEAIRSEGGKCGITAIYCRFFETLAQKFGAAFTNLSQASVGRGTKFFADCEKILRSFDAGMVNRQYALSLTLAEEVDHDDYDIETGEVYLRGSEIKDAIDSTLLYVQELLFSQWDLQEMGKKKKVNTTIICGGGSLIPYVFKRLREICSQNGITALRAKDPDSAVCRGAAISELSEDVFGLRLSRASFGIEAQRDGHQFVHWFISRGEEIDVSKGIVLKRLVGHVILSVNEILYEDGRFEMPIYMYDKTTEPPRSKSSLGVERISTIKIDRKGFSKYLENKLKKQLNQEGTDMTHMSVTVNLSVDRSGRLFFEAKNGQSCIGRGQLRLDATERSPNV